MPKDPNMTLGPMPPRFLGTLASMGKTDRITILFDREMNLGEQIYVSQCIEAVIRYVREESEKNMQQEADQLLKDSIEKLKNAKG